MQPDRLKFLYFSELQEACSFREQLSQALPALAEKTSDANLRNFLRDGMPPTPQTGARLKELLGRHRLSEHHHTDNCAQTILREALDWASGIDDPPIRDAALAASAQRLLHHALAVDRSLADSARQLDLEDLAVLTGAIDDTSRANTWLNVIAADLVRESTRAPDHAASIRKL